MRPLQSIILVTKNPGDYVKMQFGVDISSQNPDIYCINPEKSTGIEAVREALTYAVRPPLTGTAKHLIFLKGETLTLEAQNALLKLLEEPPPHLVTLISVPQASVLIDTIISRCHIMSDLKSPLAHAQNTALYDEFCALPPPGRLALIPGNTKSKTDAVAFINQLLSASQCHYHHQPSSKNLHNLTLLTKCLEALDKNANPTLSITDVLMQLV